MSRDVRPRPQYEPLGLPKRPRCEECGKWRFATLTLAEQVLHVAAFVGNRSLDPDGKIPVSAYLGRCGWFHLSPQRSGQ